MLFRRGHQTTNIYYDMHRVRYIAMGRTTHAGKKRDNLLAVWMANVWRLEQSTLSAHFPTLGQFVWTT